MKDKSKLWAIHFKGYQSAFIFIENADAGFAVLMSCITFVTYTAATQPQVTITLNVINDAATACFAGDFNLTMPPDEALISSGGSGKVGSPVLTFTPAFVEYSVNLEPV